MHGIRNIFKTEQSPKSQLSIIVRWGDFWHAKLAESATATRFRFYIVFHSSHLQGFRHFSIFHLSIFGSDDVSFEIIHRLWPAATIFTSFLHINRFRGSGEIFYSSSWYYNVYCAIYVVSIFSDILVLGRYLYTYKVSYYFNVRYFSRPVDGIRLALGLVDAKWNWIEIALPFPTTDRASDSPLPRSHNRPYFSKLFLLQSFRVSVTLRCTAVRANYFYISLIK